MCDYVLQLKAKLILFIGSEQTRRDTVPRNMNRRRSVARKEISNGNVTNQREIMSLNKQ